MSFDVIRVEELVMSSYRLALEPGNANPLAKHTEVYGVSAHGLLRNGPVRV